ncbi:MAG: hypothetical protein Q4C53_07690, partial [Clostridia bacterium]|nr:hypothetical protein [Clostridia bacterium]
GLIGRSQTTPLRGGPDFGSDTSKQRKTDQAQRFAACGDDRFRRTRKLSVTESFHEADRAFVSLNRFEKETGVTLTGQGFDQHAHGFRGDTVAAEFFGDPDPDLGNR